MFVEVNGVTIVLLLFWCWVTDATAIDLFDFFHVVQKLILVIICSLDYTFCSKGRSQPNCSSNWASLEMFREWIKVAVIVLGETWQNLANTVIFFEPLCIHLFIIWLVRATYKSLGVESACGFLLVLGAACVEGIDIDQIIILSIFICLYSVSIINHQLF